MGTNYYARIDVCSHCNRSKEEFHIGKSSFGWKFGFRGYNSWEIGYPIESEKDWKIWFESTEHTITDEYGKDITDEEFWSLVESKRSEELDHKPYSLLNDKEDKETGSIFTMSEFS